MKKFNHLNRIIMKKEKRIWILQSMLIGMILVFISSCKKEKENVTVTDIGGNIYHTVTIGTRVWMGENLKTTKYSNGDSIGTTTPANLNISGQSTPKYQWAYGGIEGNVATYGRLYTWYAVTDSRNICPTGWHVPTNDELTTLITNFGADSISGAKLKETSTTHWKSPNTGATNESGFTALPGGYRGYEGSFYYLGYTGYWWSAMESDAANAWYRGLYYNNKTVHSLSNSKKVGFAVRCLRN